MAVSFSGELAWELHIPNAQLRLAFDTLWAAGQPFGMVPFGALATESMRIEKGFRHWKADLLTEFDPYESGLARFVREGNDYTGAAALVERRAASPKQLFVMLALDADHASPHPGDSILKDGKIVGTVTSASWGHRTGLNLAMGFVNPDCSAADTALDVDLLGTTVSAKVLDDVPYDPAMSLVRS